MKVCPRGWHLPTDKEWDKLFRFVDGDKGTESPYKSETAGKHLKAVSGWSSGKEFDGNGTDKFGFSALPGGHCLPSIGGFYDAVTNGFWWSARMEGIYHAYLRVMYYNNENAYWADSPKSFLFSVRCIKD
jgi:uncharacterized protein (TIGR02145 family)